MEQHPIQGGVEIFLVDSLSYRNWYKLQPGGSLGSYDPMEGRWKFQGKYNYVWSLTGELCIIIHMGTVLFQENIHSHPIWNLDEEGGSKEEKTEIDSAGVETKRPFKEVVQKFRAQQCKSFNFMTLRSDGLLFVVLQITFCFFNSCL